MLTTLGCLCYGIQFGSHQNRVDFVGDSELACTLIKTDADELSVAPYISNPEATLIECMD